MNNKSFIYTYLFTLIAGVLLIVLHGREKIFEGMCIILGIGFLVLGILSLLSAVFISDKARQAGIKRSPVLIIVSGASFILGLLMVMAPAFFVNYLIYAMGALLVLCGVIQLCNFMPDIRTLGLSGWFLTAPVLSIGFGVAVFVIGAEKILNVLALVTGIVLVVYSINGFFGYFSRRGLALRRYMQQKPKETLVNVK